MKKLNPQCKRWPQVKTHWKQNLRWRLLLDRSWIQDGLKWYNIIKQIWQTLKNGSSKQSYELAMNFNWDVVVNFCKYYPSYFTKPGTGSQLSLITRLGPNPLYINSWNNQNAFLTAFWWFRSTSSLHTPKVCLSIYSKNETSNFGKPFTMLAIMLIHLLFLWIQYQQQSWNVPGETKPYSQTILGLQPYSFALWNSQARRCPVKNGRWSFGGDKLNLFLISHWYYW